MFISFIQYQIPKIAIMKINELYNPVQSDSCVPVHYHNTVTQLLSSSKFVYRPLSWSAYPAYGLISGNTRSGGQESDGRRWLASPMTRLVSRERRRCDLWVILWMSDSRVKWRHTTVLTTKLVPSSLSSSSLMNSGVMDAQSCLSSSVSRNLPLFLYSCNNKQNTKLNNNQSLVHAMHS